MRTTARKRALIGGMVLVLAAWLGATRTATADATTTARPGIAAAANPVVAVSPTDTPAQIRAKAATVTPSARQLNWQRRELTAFVHFGVNTYTSREHGTGTEDPSIFQPTELDTDQWARALKDAGFKQVILTVKHHDGFLLFPSRYSGFGVTATSWRGGNGDVVRDLANSARAQGLAFGIYTSPADLHEARPGGRYANGSVATDRTIPSDPADVVDGQTFSVRADDYNTYFMNTLYELLTRYGDIAEVWWDGANPTGTSNPYNYTDWIHLVRALQPSAVIFQDVDNRWVGNEDGVGRPSEWSPTPLTGDAATAADRFLEPEDERAGDLAGDTVLGQRKADGTSRWSALRWTPAECDASIMVDGWFWPANAMKTPAQLENEYYTSVGRNCQLLLDVGPDRRGLLDQATLDALSAFHSTIAGTFATDLTAGASAADDSGTGHSGGHAPAAALDGSLDTSWQPTADTGALVLDLAGPKTFDVISVQEDLNIGMRTQSFAVDRWTGSGWSEIATDTTIGHKKLVRLAAPVTTDRLRLRITGSRSAPAIASLSLFERAAGSAQPGITAPLRSGLDSKCLDDDSAGSADGTRVQIYDCNGSLAQLWTVNSGGTVQILGKCLDAYGGGTANGTRVQLYTCHGGANQQWRASGGALVNPASGRCLDVPGFNSANGTQVVLWDCNAGANQRWTSF
ncbi:alpha-L-fucosidase [Streptomyces sp. NBC_00203]|uniref:alpha-L-fucosidase n=1 Tax=Streptomyces sp. NBC_00203 TaxID=2975680 RepID=UPI003251EDEB